MGPTDAEQDTKPQGSALEKAVAELTCSLSPLQQLNTMDSKKCVYACVPVHALDILITDI